ncbi:MAG: MupA/Atu3671 family FMN-dependent luciferase-like monooxygenase [Pyrinomonadaceae bacterium]
MNFGLMFFASSEDAISGSRYRVVLESARFADRHGFSSVWVPERHFTKFGSLYPNAAVLHAALAVATERIRLNAGSVVAPLHDPLRIAEEWSMVDNLSGGRVGVSFASGWNPDDFAFFPARYGERQEFMVEGVRAVRRLWRGETTKAVSGNGEEINVRVYPSPVQPELPVWLTAAGNPGTYALAGELGANLLTHLLDQDEEQLAAKIALYRQARASHGWKPEAGVVTVMLHTFVGADDALTREQARVPFCQYIKSNIGLLKGLSHSRGQNVDISSMPERDLDEFVNFLYERFAAERGLIGSPESCLPLVKRLHAVGVNEVACLLDFGPAPELILGNLPHLSRLKDLCRTRPAGEAQRREATARFSPESVQARCTSELSGAEFDERLRSRGVEIDGQFKAVERIWRRDGEALGRIRLPPGATAPAGDFTIRPAFLDACSRVLAAALPEDSGGGLYLPAKVRSLRIAGAVPVAGWSHAVISPPPDGTGQRMLEGDIDIYDLEGRPAIRIEGLRLERPLPEAVEERAARDEGVTYKRGWVVRPSGAARALPAGRWLIFSDRGGVGASLSALLAESGAAFTLVSPEECDAADPAAVNALVAREAPRHVLHLRALDAAPPEETTVESLARDQETACACALHLIQAVAGRTTESPIRVCFVTKGAMAVRDAEPVAVAQAPLWGLARVAAVEHPKTWGGVVDLDGALPAPEAARQLFEWLLAPDGEDMVAFRASRRHVARLQADAPSAARGVSFDGSATYLITGGSGGLGLEVARWMTDLGARNLALVSRSEPAAEAASAVRRLEQGGVRARVFRADVSSADELSGVISEVGSTMPPLRGVLHLAGTLDDRALAGQTWPRFRAAGLAKVEGAWNLHRLTQGAALDFFVLFSSMASLVSVPGQGSYAAANAFLDALAHYRRALGLPALCVNWGPWSEVGHAATAYGRGAHARLAGMGIGAVSPRTGLRLLGTLLGRGETQVGVARVDWSKLFQADPAAALSPLLSEQARDAVPTPAQAEEPELLKTLRALPEAERREELAAFLSSLLAETLKLKSREPLTPRQGLFELGLDSILALQLKAKLELNLGRPFPATLFFTHPTVESLADYLSGELKPPADAAGPPPAASETPEAAAPVTGEAPSTDSLTDEEIARLIAQEIGYGQLNPRT